MTLEVAALAIYCGFSLGVFLVPPSAWSPDNQLDHDPGDGEQESGKQP